jgi:hemolysin activation/secretion protein
MVSTLALGADFKRYRQTSYNTNENKLTIRIPDSGAPGGGGLDIISTNYPQGLPVSHTALDYLPLNVGLSGSVPDQWGTTFFNAQANFNVSSFLSSDADFAKVAYTTNIHAHYVTVQAGADRVQTIYRDWSVKLHADGQWANGALFGNEQYGMGGSGSVRGYTDGQDYGDTGWRASIEPQTPLVNIGMVDGDVPFWVRGSVFLDYGELYRFQDTPGTPPGLRTLHFMGTGLGVTANIGNHLDARLTVAFPLYKPAGGTGFGPVYIYFGVGAQF